ncbi:hypothetical protein ON010_g16523 [Phytophthora cinnamomi]|nr:hypothetical protein ON010_g16523 [Phytophthora cinnamomi]
MADVTVAGVAAASCSPLAPTELEREHVHKVYDLIAPHFSHTRHHPWPQVTQFLEQLEPDALVADVGCGNGKYLRVNPSLYMIGADRSIPLMQTASLSDWMRARNAALSSRMSWWSGNSSRSTPRRRRAKKKLTAAQDLTGV